MKEVVGFFGRMEIRVLIFFLENSSFCFFYYFSVSEIGPEYFSSSHEREYYTCTPSVSNINCASTALDLAT